MLKSKLVRQIEAVKLQHKHVKYKLNECMYGVGSLGVEFFQCKTGFGSTWSISFGFYLHVKMKDILHDSMVYFIY